MVQLDGEQTKLVRGKENRDQAHTRFHELMLQRAANPAPASEAPTVASIIDLYLASASRQLSQGTLPMLKYRLQAFAEAHGWRLIRDCLPFHLTNWLDNNPQWATDWTRNSVVSIVHRPFNWAVKQRLIQSNPFAGVTHRPGQPIRPITEDEFQALLRAATRPGARKRPTSGARFRQVLMFLRLTGCRPGELCKLEWRHIDLERCQIVLPEHKTSRTQRVPRPRVVPLIPTVIKLLVHIRKRQEPGERVFLTHRKTPWTRSSLALRIRRARLKVGLPVDAKLYGLRHSFGTRAIINGVDIKSLSALMGHTDTRMTEHYVHLAGQNSHLAAAMSQATKRPHRG
jgi:integrase